jgi:hypothetical protein
MVAASITDFSPQAGPPAITSFTTAANFESGLFGPSTAVHLSFTIGRMAAHHSAPPFFKASGEPLSTSSVTKEAATTALLVFLNICKINPQAYGGTFVALPLWSIPKGLY